MAKDLKIPDNMLSDLLKEVQEELNSLELSKSEKLSKAHEGEDEDLPDGPPSDPAPAASAVDPSDDSALVPPQDAAGAPHGEPDGDEGMGAAPGAPSDPAAETPPTVEELQEEYAKLSPDELKMHFEAAKAALSMLMGSGPGMEASSGGPSPSGPPPEASAPPMMAMKAEMKSNDGSGAISVGKSEKASNTLQKSAKDVQIESLRAEVASQAKALEKLVEYVATPVRKSVKNVSELAYLKKTESEEKQMTKAEATELLREKVRSGKLSKAERTLATDFYLGNVDISKIKPLLNK